MAKPRFDGSPFALIAVMRKYLNAGDLREFFSGTVARAVIDNNDFFFQAMGKKRVFRFLKDFLDRVFLIVDSNQDRDLLVFTNIRDLSSECICR